MEDIIMSPSVVLACCGSTALVSLVPSCRVSTVVGGQMMGKPGFAESPLFFHRTANVSGLLMKNTAIRGGRFCSFYLKLARRNSLLRVRGLTLHIVNIKM